MSKRLCREKIGGNVSPAIRCNRRKGHKPNQRGEINHDFSGGHV